MTSLAFHGTSMRPSTMRIRYWCRGINESMITTTTTTTTSATSLSRSHSLFTASRSTSTKYLIHHAVATAPSNFIRRTTDVLSFPSRFSGLLLPQNRTSSIVKTLRNPSMNGTTTMSTVKRINLQSTLLPMERVYTTTSKRHLLFATKSPLSTSVREASRMRGSHCYRIPTSSMIRCNTMMQSPYNVLSLVQYYSEGGPSRWPQLNRPNTSSSSNRWAQGVGIIGAASVLFGKTKYMLAALKLTKFASLGSMVLSIGAYSMVFGWPYAIGVVGLIFCHECGHLAVMVNRGIPFSPMVFIPFVGAVIATKEQPRDAWEDALVASGGPFAGTMASCAVAVAANMTNSQLLYALADFGYMINLINMLPIGSLDGGRWAGALSKYVSAGGTVIGGYLAWTGFFSNPIFYLVVLAGAYETFMRFYDPYRLPPNFYRISNTQRAILTGGYFGLIAFLVTAMAANQRQQKPPDVLAREQGKEPFWDSSSF